MRVHAGFFFCGGRGEFLFLRRLVFSFQGGFPEDGARANILVVIVVRLFGGKAKDGFLWFRWAGRFLWFLYVKAVGESIHDRGSFLGGEDELKQRNMSPGAGGGEMAVVVWDGPGFRHQLAASRGWRPGGLKR